MLGCVIQLIPDQRMLFPLQGSELIMLYLGPASFIMVTQGLFWSNLLAFDTEQQSRTTEQVTGAEGTARPPVHYLSFCPGKAKLPRRDQSLQSSHMPSSSFRKPALLESLQGQWHSLPSRNTWSTPATAEALSETQKWKCSSKRI